MTPKAWIPRGHALPTGARPGKLLSWGDQYQIVKTDLNGYALAIEPALLYRWVESGYLVEELFASITVDQKEYRVYVGKRNYMISSVQQGPYPMTSVEGHAFAVALCETRKSVCTESLHDAVYIEQISRLLPTYTLTERFDDTVVLGSWLSSGVRISTSSFRRLSILLDWMDPQEIKSIIAEAGLSKERGAGGRPTSLSTQKKETAKESAQLETGVKNIPVQPFPLPGRPELELFFNEHIVDILMHEERYRTMGIHFPSAIVLHGPPGCGKTYAVERLVEFLDWPSYSIGSGSVGSPYIHETGKKIAEIFEEASRNAPSVLIIDEMEAFLANRNMGLSSGMHHVEEMAEFLKLIPKAAQNRVLIFAMTNMIDVIDPAILRRGRFDHIVSVEMPSMEEVQQLLGTLLSKLPVAEDIVLEQLAAQLMGRSMADTAFCVREAGRLAVKCQKDSIDMDTLLAAVKLLPIAQEESRKIGF